MNPFVKIFAKLCSVLGIFSIVLSVVLTITHGFSYNNTLALLLGIGCLGLGYIYPKVSTSRRGLVNGILAIVVLFFVYMATLIMRDGVKDTVTFQEPYVIVLGSGIKGSQLTPMLRSRLDKALAYAQKNPEATFIVCGGQGRGEDIPEAQAMERYFLTHGLPAAKIIKEEQSKDTIENIKNSLKILTDREINKTEPVALITSNFHMYRAMQIAKNQGLTVNGYRAEVAWYLLPGCFLRETLSILKFWLVGRAS